MTSRILFALAVFALILFALLMSLSGPTGMPSLKALPHMIEHASLNPINPLNPQAQYLVVPSTPGQAPAAATANNAWQFEPSIFNASDLSGSSKRSYSSETSFGGPITYEILVHNSGDYTDTNASVFDPIPSGTGRITSTVSSI